MREFAYFRMIPLDCRLIFVIIVHIREQTGETMLTEQRRQMILDILKREGRALAGQLARDWNVSEDTIRRDMREMAADGLLKRVHGGAMPMAPMLPDFTTRRGVATEEKQRLAAAAIRLISPGQMVFLDGGTTTEEIARQIPRAMALTVVTHAPTLAAEFEHHPEIEVILIGGRLYKHSMVAVGAAAIAAIDRLRPDIFFLGVTAAHPVEGLTTGDFEEAAIKRRIVERSAATYVPLTLEKLDTVSPCLVALMSEITGLIVVQEDKPRGLGGYREAGVEIVVA